MFLAAVYFHSVTGYSLGSFNLKAQVLLSWEVLISFLDTLFTVFFLLDLQ